MSTFQKVAQVSEIPAGGCKNLVLGDREIALFNIDGKICAITNTCPHRGGPLGEGDLEGKTVTCPWHGWQFDVTTGVSPVNPSATIATYEVKVEGNDVLVGV